MNTNFTLDSGVIEHLVADDISERLLLSRQFRDEIKHDITTSYRADTSPERLDAYRELERARVIAISDATGNIRKLCEEAVERAKVDAEKAAKERLTRDISRRWNALGNIANEEWVRGEMRTLIREQVRQAFGRTAHQLARSAMKTAHLAELQAKYGGVK